MKYIYAGFNLIDFQLSLNFVTFESELLNQESGQTFWSNEKCLYHSENFLQASWLLFKGGTERLGEIEEECAKEKWEKLKKASDPDHFWGDSFHNQDMMFLSYKMIYEKWQISFSGIIQRNHKKTRIEFLSFRDGKKRPRKMVPSVTQSDIEHTYPTPLPHS